MSYVTGYNGTVRTREQLLAWSHWQALDPEFARRTLALLDASNTAGRPLGIGSVVRTTQGQRDLFLSRHYVVASGGCCTYEGKRYALRPGMAHAAPPGRSYHERTTPDDHALAIDFTGDLKFLAEHAAAYGMIEFTEILKEPWHAQPKEPPTARRRYVPAQHHPLPVIALPDAPAPAPTRVIAPRASIRQGVANDKAQVRHLQHLCNFWSWRDAQNRNLVVDGDYGPRSAQAVMAMQRFFAIPADGWYGPQSAGKLQLFLDGVVRLGMAAS